MAGDLSTGLGGHKLGKRLVAHVHDMGAALREWTTVGRRTSRCAGDSLTQLSSTFGLFALEIGVRIRN